MEKEIIANYEGKIVDLQYDWECGNSGNTRGFVLRGECYQYGISEENIRIMRIPSRYIKDLYDSQFEISFLELSVLQAFSRGSRQINGYSIELLRSTKEI